LTNVVRHAHASKIDVELRAADGGLSLVVRDDGVGFDVAAAMRRAESGTSLGIVGMEERAALVGGSMALNSAPGEGTEVRAWFPISVRQAPA